MSPQANEHSQVTTEAYPLQKGYLRRDEMLYRPPSVDITSTVVQSTNLLLAVESISPSTFYITQHQR